ncbi:MAG TPA: PEP/pyruvate-binding domain-containing protein [Solirubrobacteraceae bacterium]|nr:PEP/pyruvate-binding domain-containing protein [Solirubrobacteraceae bacterium]
MSSVLDLAAGATEGVERVGGKALGLLRLTELGCAVPPGFVVTTDAHRAWMRDHGLDAEVARLARAADDFTALRAASDAIRALFEAAGLDDEAIDRAYDDLGAPPVAIRSSATAEDLGDASFAGQQETYLPVAGRDAVRAHVVKCWASLYSLEAISYRRRLSVEIEDVAMAVVVQRLVPAEAAGVLFTIDPLTGDRSQITIEASFGLGLALVGGDVTPDRFAIDKVTLEIRSRAIATKPFADRFDPRTATLDRAQLSSVEASAPAISDDEVVALAQVGKRVEASFGQPMDIEWALGPGPGGHRQVHLLQARPETVHGAEERDAGGPQPAMDRIVSALLKDRQGAP